MSRISSIRARLRPWVPALALLFAVGCAGGVELPAEVSLPVKVPGGIFVSLTAKGLAFTLGEAVKAIRAEHPDGYPLVISPRARYDAREDRVLLYGSATMLARVKAAHAEPEPETDTLRITLDLEALVANVPVSEVGSEMACEVPVVIGEPSVTFVLHSSRSKVGKIEVYQSGDVTMDGAPEPIPGGTCTDLEFQGAAKLVHDAVVSNLRAQLTTGFVATMAPIVGKSLVFRLPPGRRIDVPDGLSVASHLSHRLLPSVTDNTSPVLDVQETRTVMPVSLAFESTRHSCVPDEPIAEAAEAQPPELTDVIPDSGEEYDLAIAVSVASFRQALGHAFRSGLLCDSVGATQVPALTTKALTPWLPDASLLAKDAPLWVRFWPRAVPGISLSDKGAGKGGLSLHVFFPELELELYADIDETRLLLYRLTAAVSLGLHAELGAPDGDGSPLLLVLDEVATDGLALESPMLAVPESPDDGSAEGLFEVALGAYLEKSALLTLPVGGYSPVLESARSDGGSYATFYLSLLPAGAAPPTERFAPTLGPPLGQSPGGLAEASREAGGCRTPGQHGSTANPWWLLVLAMAALPNRRRAR